jgi:hypothetical protein
VSPALGLPPGQTAGHSVQSFLTGLATPSLHICRFWETGVHWKTTSPASTLRYVCAWVGLKLDILLP